MPTKKCKVKSELLREYMAAREKLQAAQREYKQILAADTGEGATLRSRQRIEAIKSLASEARIKYACHCHVHRC
jgi:site-specific recombinase XerD